MELEKQKLILSCLSANRDLMALSSGMLKPSFFDPSLKKSVKFLQDYFTKFRDVPKASIIKAETGVVLEDVGQVTPAEIKYLSEEIETFCRHRAVTEAIVAGPEFLKTQNFTELIKSLKDAISIGLQKDLGLDYFHDPISRLESTLSTENRISTGWADLDQHLGGGISRQELITFLANSGGGKSMTMLNLARNFLAQGLNGVYISLEMGEATVSKRLDSMISHIAQGDLFKDMHKVADSISKASRQFGQFRIKRFPENRTNVNDIRGWLTQLEQASGFKPDFIIVDYIDIMGTTAAVSLDNMFTKDKYVTEEIRSLGFDYNCIMVSAAQLGRAAIEAEQLNQAHIQGGISKINTSDYVVGIKQTDLMRAQGEIWFQILKSRNSGGVGQKILLAWDQISLLVTSLAKSANLAMSKKPAAAPLPTGGTVFSGAKKDNSILTLFNTED